MIRLTASDFYSFYRPSKCNGRIYLKRIGEEEAPPGPFEEVLQRLGERHERQHLETLGSFSDISVGNIDDRVRETIKQINGRALVLYQGLLMNKCFLGGVECEIAGEPDFLIFEGNGYVIRDSKLSLRITEKDHPEIFRQLELYGWLYEQMFGRSPLRLEVHGGNNDIVCLPYDKGVASLDLLQKLLAIKQSRSEVYEPVGWSKCNGCSFNPRCWPLAEKSLDVAIIPGVDQGLAIALHKEGVESINELLSKFDENRLAEFKRPWGDRIQRVGKKAESIFRMAECIVEAKEIILNTPKVPNCDNYVMFDLEGLPPHLDELEKIYLWGIQVFGEEQGKYIPAVAGFGEKGDAEGWKNFLTNAQIILRKYPDIPFVHWHHYERVRIDMYIERYGDPEGIATRVRENLLDLLPICQNSIALPIPSYSLKVVERYAGFKRTQDEYGGEWAMAKYIEAIETEDVRDREKLMGEILKYNREDLEATWHVLKWLKSKKK